MLRSLLSQLRGRTDDGTTPDEEGGSAGLLRSRLDVSVLVAHGFGDDSDRELSEVKSEAERLEEAQRTASRSRTE